jgi:hypothetical protein
MLAVMTAELPVIPSHATVAVLLPLSVIVAPAAVKEAVPTMFRRCAVTVIYDGVVVPVALTWNVGESLVIKIVAS